MLLHDPATLDPSALRALIESRVLAAPRTESENDWRHGPVSPERRRHLRKFFPEQPVPAAVLVPIVEREEGLWVLLTQRASHLSHHPGQISFPGGRLDHPDEDFVQAALRETEEEVGVSRDLIRVAGFLPDHFIVTGYRVTPVVGFVDPRFTPRVDPTEVAEVFEVPLSFLLDARNHVRRVRRFENQDIEFTDFPYQGRNIWGATAGMLMTLYRMLRGEDA
ncbi:MAG: CoA pyrophosphatase [Gammaproteobacteria bacterium]|nr:CoA pyrophosphatase [Gammaproteobacteria bacterium]